MGVRAEQEVANLVRERAAEDHAEPLLVERGELISRTAAGTRDASHSARSFEISAMGWLSKQFKPLAHRERAIDTRGHRRRSTTIARSRSGAGECARSPQPLMRHVPVARWPPLRADHYGPNSSGPRVRDGEKHSTRETVGASLS